MREETVKVRLSANTGDRLMVVGTASLSSKAEPAPRLWVQSENGGFEELRSGAAVTVLRGCHAIAGWEPGEVSERASRISRRAPGPSGTLRGQDRSGDLSVASTKQPLTGAAVEVWTPGTYADFDKDGRLLGIEVLDASVLYDRAELEQLPRPGEGT